MEKRICLLAGYDNQNILREYVVFLVQQLSKLSEVCYFSDGQMSEMQLDKIRSYTTYAGSAPHPGCDFGSWQYLIHRLGWKNLSEYDELILCNDSIYGPMTDLKDIFEYMELRDYDFWSMTENNLGRYHLDSYFIVFNNEIIKNRKFQAFWDQMTPAQSRHIYAELLTSVLTEEGFVGNGFIKNYGKEDPLAYPLYLLKKRKMPFIRIKSLRQPMYYLKEPALFIDRRLKHTSGYNTDLIKNHLAAFEDYHGFGLGYYLHQTLQSLKHKATTLLLK